MNRLLKYTSKTRQCLCSCIQEEGVSEDVWRGAAARKVCAWGALTEDVWGAEVVRGECGEEVREKWERGG